MQFPVSLLPVLFWKRYLLWTVTSFIETTTAHNETAAANTLKTKHRRRVLHMSNYNHKTLKNQIKINFVFNVYPRIFSRLSMRVFKKTRKLSNIFLNMFNGEKKHRVPMGNQVMLIAEFNKILQIDQQKKL